MNRLDLLDRGTLATWRVVNAVSWGAASLAVAAFLRGGFEAWARVFQNSLQDLHSTGDLIRYLGLVALPGAIIGGAAIGTICARRVHRGIAMTATTAGTLFTALLVLAAESSIPGRENRWIHVAAVLVPVVAYLIVRRRRRRAE